MTLNAISKPERLQICFLCFSWTSIICSFPVLVKVIFIYLYWFTFNL